MTAESGRTGVTWVGECLEHLINLGRRKEQVIRRRQHAELQAIVRAEQAALDELALLGAPDRPEARLAADWQALSGSIRELQQVNQRNATLLAEYLHGVSFCLCLLERAANPTYSVQHDKHVDGPLMSPVLDLRG